MEKIMKKLFTLSFLMFVLVVFGHGADTVGTPDSREAQAKVERLNEILRGQPLPPTENRMSPQAPDPKSLALRMSLGLATVLFLLWLVVLLLRKMRGEGGTIAKRGQGILQVLETVHLGNGQRVVLLRVGEKVLTVGTTTDSVRHLNTLEGEDAIRLLAQAGQGVAGPAQFGATVNHLLRHFRRDAGR